MDDEHQVKEKQSHKEPIVLSSVFTLSVQAIRRRSRKGVAMFYKEPIIRWWKRRGKC